MRYLILLTIFALTRVCGFAQDKTLYLDPEKATGLKAADLFSEIEIIPLETTKASYFNNMADFLITPDRLIFTDNASNSILIFDKKGKFLHKFKKKKYRLGALQYIHEKNAVFFTSTNKNYSIPMKKAHQILNDPRERDFSRYFNIELLYLNDNENYRIEKLPVPKYALLGLYYVNGMYLFQHRNHNSEVKDTVLYHANFIRDNKIVRSYFPFLNIPKLAPDYEGIDCNIDRTLNDSVFYIQKSYDNTIYRLVNDSIEPAYQFVFPSALTMPPEFHTTAFKNNIDFTSYKNDHAKAIRSFFNIVDIEDVLFFGMNDGKWSSKRYAFVKNNSMLYDLGKTTTDSTVHFLPSKIFSRLSNYDEQYIYTYLSSEDLLKEKTGILARYKDAAPTELLNAYEELTKFKNPIIIRFKVKPNTATK